jgi:hypothetical protein
MPSGGNSTKKLYSEAVHGLLVAAEKKGLSRAAVAAMGGLAPRTYLRWLEKGKSAAEAQDEGEECLAVEAQYAQLWRDTEKARALWESDQLDLLNDEDEKQWQKHAWKLERRLPSEYGMGTRGDNTGTPAVQVTIIGNPEALALQRQALRLLTAPKEPDAQ